MEFVQQLGLIDQDEHAALSDEGEGADDDLLMEQLLEVALLDTRPIVMSNAILPGQTMRLQIADSPHRAMIAKCLEIGLESQGFGVVGMDQRTQVPLMFGTEVRITECSASWWPTCMQVRPRRLFTFGCKATFSCGRQTMAGKEQARGWRLHNARVKWIDFELGGVSSRIVSGNNSSTSNSQAGAEDDIVVIGDDDDEDDTDERKARR